MFLILITIFLQKSIYGILREKTLGIQNTTFNLNQFIFKILNVKKAD